MMRVSSGAVACGPGTGARVASSSSNVICGCCWRCMHIEFQLGLAVWRKLNCQGSLVFFIPRTYREQVRMGTMAMGKLMNQTNENIYDPILINILYYILIY